MASMIAMMVMDLSVIAKMMREEILNNLCLLSGWKQNQTLMKRRTLMVIHYGYDNDKDTFFNTQINAIASRDVNEGLFYL